MPKTSENGIAVVAFATPPPDNNKIDAIPEIDEQKPPGINEPKMPETPERKFSESEEPSAGVVFVFDRKKRTIIQNDPKPPSPPKMTIYESTFAKSKKTDAILVVNGRPMHVNKTLLSYHSNYFEMLFNSEFCEDNEFPIGDVKFEDFATLLSFVQNNPIEPNGTQHNLETLLDLADRFSIPAAKSHLELYICSTNSINTMRKLRLADKYNLDILLNRTLQMFDRKDYRYFHNRINSFTSNTKVKVFDCYFSKFGDSI